MDVVANGVRFNCAVSGLAGRPWLVLAHGVATDVELWEDAASILGQHYRILRYDIRGHGGTDPVAGGYTFDQLCSDVVAIMDRLGIVRAHFAGISLGGMTALGLALDHASRFDRLVVCNASDEASPAYIANWESREHAVREQGIEAIVEPSVQRWLAPATLRDNPLLVSRARDMVRRTSVEGYLGAAHALKSLAFRSRLDSIALPVLYLAGCEDAGASPQVMRAMSERTPGASYVQLDGVGHLSAFEAPRETADAIHTFLSAR